MGFQLTILHGARECRLTFAFEVKVVLIGRNVSSDLVLTDRRVSGFHLVIRFTGSGGYLLEDLGSTNGTFHNDKKVLQARLVHGDILRIGSIRVRFEDRALPKTDQTSARPTGASRSIHARHTLVTGFSPRQGQVSETTALSPYLFPPPSACACLPPGFSGGGESGSGLLRSMGIHSKATANQEQPPEGLSLSDRRNILQRLLVTLRPPGSTFGKLDQRPMGWFGAQQKGVRLAIMVLIGLAGMGMALWLSSCW